MKRLLLLLALGGCRATLSGELDVQYATAVEASAKGRPALAAAGMYAVLQQLGPDAPRTPRAQLLYASALEELELTAIAGLQYRDIASERRDLEIVPDALRGLERIVASGVYDHDTLVQGFLAAEDFGFLDAEQRAFVDYFGGLDLARRGYPDWAERRFDRIEPTSPYAHRASFVRAVQHIARGEDPAAIAILDAMPAEIPVDLARDRARTMARLAFGAGDYDTAMTWYERSQALGRSEGEVLLEMAWTAYHQGQADRVLGLLVALDAPAHAAYAAPERFTLKALTLRRLCQWRPAVAVEQDLLARHGVSLDALSAGAQPIDVPTLVQGARERGAAAVAARWAERVAWERDHATKLALGKEHKARLDELYSRQVEVAEARLAEALRSEVALLTEELLVAVETVGLVIHEQGVALLRGRKRPRGAEPFDSPPRPLASEAIFRFDGEYWSDEVDDLVVLVEDRCVE